MSAMPCRCVFATHERKDCRIRPIVALRADLFRDQFDSGYHKPGRIRPPRVQVLNPAYLGDDPASRRFSLLEIDD